MDGVYFAQGAEAAQDATSWDDAARLCPYLAHGQDLYRRRVWMNGFAYRFKPPVDVTDLLAAFTLSGRLKERL